MFLLLIQIWARPRLPHYASSYAISSLWFMDEYVLRGWPCNANMIIFFIYIFFHIFFIFLYFFILSIFFCGLYPFFSFLIFLSSLFLFFASLNFICYFSLLLFLILILTHIVFIISSRDRHI